MCGAELGIRVGYINDSLQDLLAGLNDIKPHMLIKSPNRGIANSSPYQTSKLYLLLESTEENKEKVQEQQL